MDYHCYSTIEGSSFQIPNNKNQMTSAMPTKFIPFQTAIKNIPSTMDENTFLQTIVEGLLRPYVQLSRTEFWHFTLWRHQLDDNNSAKNETAGYDSCHRLSVDDARDIIIAGQSEIYCWALSGRPYRGITITRDRLLFLNSDLQQFQITHTPQTDNQVRIRISADTTAQIEKHYQHILGVPEPKARAKKSHNNEGLIKSLQKTTYILATAYADQLYKRGKSCTPKSIGKEIIDKFVAKKGGITDSMIASFIIGGLDAINEELRQFGYPLTYGHPRCFFPNGLPYNWVETDTKIKKTAQRNISYCYATIGILVEAVGRECGERCLQGRGKINNSALVRELAPYIPLHVEDLKPESIRRRITESGSNFDTR